MLDLRVGFLDPIFRADEDGVAQGKDIYLIHMEFVADSGDSLFHTEDLRPIFQKDPPASRARSTTFFTSKTWS